MSSADILLKSEMCWNDANVYTNELINMDAPIKITWLLALAQKQLKWLSKHDSLKSFLA